MRAVFRRILGWEPGISLGQWVYDKVVGNWALLSSLFGGGLMSYAAAVTEWIAPWGALGWGSIGLVSAILILLALSVSRYAYSVAESRRAQATYLTALS